MQSNTTSKPSKQDQDRLHGAALIDAKGKETPITEDMIQQVLKKIINA